MDIKAYREKHGLSQRAFGELVGRTQGAVSQWEAGGPIDVETVKLIALATDNEVTAYDCIPSVFPKGFRFPDPEPLTASIPAP